MARKKKERKLTEAEQRRLSEFNETCDNLAAQGYKQTNLVISLVAANVIAIAAFAVLGIACLLLFSKAYPDTDFSVPMHEFIIYLVVFVVLVVAHELVHGLTWSRFTPNGFADIDFGIMRDSLTPYCTCKMPLPKGQYILGALMPLIAFGLIPIVAAFCTGWIGLLYLGILMTVSAAGDVMIVVKALGHKSTASEVLLYDHPTEAGSVIFER